MTKPDLLHLACKHCGWVIPEDITLGMVSEHFRTEHPEAVKEDGEPKIDLDMVACCIKCNDKMPLFAKFDQGDHFELHYNCERCRRTYRINQNKDAAETSPEAREGGDSAK